MMEIRNCTALVTGSNRGIGRALVEALLERGARRIYAGARGRSAIDAIGQIDRERVLPIDLDITDSGSVARAAAAASDVDLLVNNAGVLQSFDVMGSDIESVRRDMETNFFGLLNMVRSFTPALESRGDATVVNVLTVAALASIPLVGGYAASKAAALSFTQSIRAKLAPKGIAVVAAFPGPVDTDMARGLDMPKAAPQTVARAILDGVEAGATNVFPDPTSRDLGALWARDPAELERRLSSMV
jgi:NAD(P)-dependent dehydrogenase (short-subunit alcohol dehydrogenase family)